MVSIYVTGCDTGFGSILVQELASKEGQVSKVFAGCYTQEAADTLTAQDNCVIGVRLDVTKEDSVLAAAKVIESNLGGKGLDGVVNNAGVMSTAGPVEWTPLNDYRRMIEVNVLGTVSVTKSVLPLIRKARGRIVNVASVAGMIGLPSQSAYCVSKYGVEAFSDVLRRDMLPWGVSVHVIEPGVYKNTGLYQTYQRGLDKLWEGLSPELKADYGQPFKDYFRSLLGLALDDFSNKDPADVPRAMLKALLSDSPQYRYKVGLDAKYFIPALVRLPERIQDFILTLSSPKLPLVNPAKAPANGYKQVAKRYKRGKGWLVVLAFFILMAFRRMRR